MRRPLDEEPTDAIVSVASTGLRGSDLHLYASWLDRG
jgi:threonine dehydrogenase-like Zn-dependent dehydrogenase